MNKNMFFRPVQNNLDSFKTFKYEHKNSLVKNTLVNTIKFSVYTILLIKPFVVLYLLHVGI